MWLTGGLFSKALGWGLEGAGWIPERVLEPQLAPFENTALMECGSWVWTESL